MILMTEMNKNTDWTLLNNFKYVTIIYLLILGSHFTTNLQTTNLPHDLVVMVIVKMILVYETLNIAT